MSNRFHTRIRQTSIAPSASIVAPDRDPLYHYGIVQGTGTTVHGQLLEDQTPVFFSRSVVKWTNGDDEVLVRGDDVLGHWGIQDGRPVCGVLGDRVMVETGYYCDGWQLSNTPPPVDHGRLIQEGKLGHFAKLIQVGGGVRNPEALLAHLNQPVMVEHDESRIMWHWTEWERRVWAAATQPGSDPLMGREEAAVRLTSSPPPMSLGHTSIILGQMNVLIMRSRWVVALLDRFPGF